MRGTTPPGTGRWVCAALCCPLLAPLLLASCLQVLATGMGPASPNPTSDKEDITWAAMLQGALPFSPQSNPTDLHLHLPSPADTLN